MDLVPVLHGMSVACRLLFAPRQDGCVLLLVLQDEWRLGHVYIGGQSSDKAQLYETFDPGLADGNWIFHPNSVLQSGYCNRTLSDSNVLVFSGTQGILLILLPVVDQIY